MVKKTNEHEAFELFFDILFCICNVVGMQFCLYNK